MKLYAGIFALSLFFFACAPPVHLNNAGREKVVIPTPTQMQKTENGTFENLERELKRKANAEISDEIKEILNVQNGANPSDLKPFDDNAIF